MANKRVYYAIQQVRIAPDGTASGSYTDAYTIHGLQQVGINTKFNLEQVFEIGQLAIYENIENVPDVEITLEKVLDGTALMYHLATPTATSATLAGRSTIKSQVLLSIFSDTKDSASGAAITETECSGMFPSQLTYTFPVQGNATESVTMVGNNKTWRTPSVASGSFPGNNDTPPGSGGVQRREDILFGSGASYCVLPPSVEGVTDIGGGSGYNILVSGAYGAAIQSIKVSASLGRDNLEELGHKAPYFRYVNFPVQVKTDIEAYCKNGDQVIALEEADNIVDETIIIKMREGLTINCGSHNKLDSVSFGGGNAGGRGGNATCTYSYTTFNDMTVTHPEDPAGL